MRKLWKMLIATTMLFSMILIGNPIKKVEAATFNNYIALDSLADFSEGNYIIASVHDNVTYAMTYNSSTSKYQTATELTLTTEITNEMIWRFSLKAGSTTNYVISNSSKYLVGASSGTDLTATVNSEPTTNVGYWSISATGNSFKIANVSVSTRSIFSSIANDPYRFANYLTSSLGTVNYATKVMLYKLKTDAEIAQENLDIDLMEVNTILANLNGKTDVTTIADLPILGNNGSIITWESSDPDLVYINPSNGKVTINSASNLRDIEIYLMAELSNTYKTATKSGYSDIILFYVLYLNPTSKFNVIFNDYLDLNRENILANTEIILPIVPASYGKKFAGWKDQNEIIHVNTLLINKTYTLTAVFDNNYDDNVNTMTSIKLGYTKTEGNSTEGEVNNSTGTLNYWANNSISTSNGTGEGALQTAPWTSTNFASGAMNTNASIESSSFFLNKNILEITPYLYGIPSSNGTQTYQFTVTLLDGEGKNTIYKVSKDIKFIVGSCDYTEFTFDKMIIPQGTIIGGVSYTLTLKKTGSTCGANNNVACSGANLRNVGIKLDYKEIASIIIPDTYTLTDSAGIRFGAEFTTDDFNKAGVLVIPSDLLGSYTSIVDYFLEEGIYDAEDNADSKLANINASNVVASAGKLFFAGIIADYPEDMYGRELVAVCYYELDGQIYFSSECTTSFKEEAQWYLDNSAGLGFELSNDDRAVLAMIASAN